MTELKSRYAPDECIRRLREALADEWGQWQPVQGCAIGWSFRLFLMEARRHPFDERHNRIRFLLYGKIYADGMGSKIKVWEFPGAWDPFVWAVHIFIFVILLLTWCGGTWPARAILLLFELTGNFLLYKSYQSRKESLKRLKIMLRRFVERVLLADGCWKEDR